MTPKQILDSFSETLMQDERILSAQERALVATLLQHAKTATGDNQETQEAVRAVIASAVGETVAQRAFAVLGGSIVERILRGWHLAARRLSAGATRLCEDTYAAGSKNTDGRAATAVRSRTRCSSLRTKNRSARDPHSAEEPQPPGAPMRTPAHRRHRPQGSRIRRSPDRAAESERPKGQPQHP